MPKPRSIDTKLERLRQLCDQNPSPEIRIELRDALLDASNHVIAAAAAIIARLRFSDLIPNLEAAFGPLMVDSLKSDKTCTGKTAIVDALNELDCQDSDLFLVGVRHFQLEPAWGGPTDTAASLRAACSLGLVRMGYSKVLPVLVDLLADPERVVRLAAAQALGASGGQAALLLLRLKARLGDHDPDVIGECLAGLMKAEPQESVSFVTEFLHHDNADIVEVALLAFGNSRRAEAFTALREFWDARPPADLQGTALLAMALLRMTVATDFLFTLVTEAPEATASLALSALAILTYDSRVHERAAAAVKIRDTKSLNNVFTEKFRAQ
jgi:HEAT repeat protein